MNKATVLALGFVMTFSAAFAPLAASAKRLTPEEIAVQREAKRLEVKRQKAEIRAKREAVAKEKRAKLIAQRLKAREKQAPSQTTETPVAAEPTTPKIDDAKFKTKAGVEYKNAQMGFDFTRALWNGYEQYAAAHQNYPELYWFENIVGYDLPIYLNEKGFSLDSGEHNYFVWNDFSDEWKVFYKQHFAMKREGSDVSMRFSLPASLDTADYGTLAPGVWYFTNTKGLVAEKDYNKSLSNYVMPVEEKAADAKRVFETALAVQKALDEYHADVRGYPIAFDRPFELGENGLTALYRENAFHGKPENNKAYITGIQSGRPSTKIIYDSRYGGQSYTITFTIYGQYDQYEPGVYEVSPYIVKKIADLK